MDFLSEHQPEILPGNRQLPPTQGVIEAPHGTTIVAVTFPGGVVLAGDRRATMGNVIAQRDIEKVFPADEYSAVGIAGTAGLAVEMVKLFQLELEHFEKVEGAQLSLEGKANRLSTMIRSNLGMAMQGLAVVPLFAGYDVDREKGRIFSYDVTGGRSEEHDYAATGSGSIFARGAMKKLFRDDLTRGRGHDAGRAGAVRRGRRRLGDRWSRCRPPDLPDRHRDHRGRIPPAHRRGVVRDRPRDPGAAAGAARRPAGRAALAAGPSCQGDPVTSTERDG